MLGPTELIILLVIALLFFGPSRLPGLGRSLGDAIRGFKKGIDGEAEKNAGPAPEQIKDAQATTSESQTQKNKSEV